MTREQTDKLNIKEKKRIIAFVILFVIVFAAVMVCLHMIERKEDAIAIEDARLSALYDKEANLVRYNGKWYKQNPNLTNLLLIGTDDLQSDFLLLIAIDNENKSYTALQINRDTMTDVPQLDIYGKEYGTKTQQIALSFAQSDSDVQNCRNTVNAVSNLLYGVDIDHFVCASMDAIPVINDLLDGVPVFVEDDFSNTDPGIVQGQTISLTGDQALNFVRARSSMDEPTNIARMARQRAYIHSLHERAIAKDAEDSDFIMKSLLDLSPYITSDCSINQLTRLFEIALAHGPSDILTIDGEAYPGGEYIEFHVDENALQEQVIELFFAEEK